MLILMPCCSKNPVKVSPVNWLPWSVLNISGLPFLSVSSRASTQKLAGYWKASTSEQTINRLREAKIHINQGIPIFEASRKTGVTEQTYYRWRREYGGLRIEQAGSSRTQTKRKLKGKMK